MHNSEVRNFVYRQKIVAGGQKSGAAKAGAAAMGAPGLLVTGLLIAYKRSTNVRTFLSFSCVIQCVRS